MKTLIFSCIVLISALTSSAFSNPELFGIVRQNYYSTFIDPIDSTIIYQQLDSTTIRLGNADPVLGFVNNIGNYTYNDAVNLTGAALNPYENTYIFMGATNMNTLDLNTGQLINQVPLNNPIAASYFDNFRFNNADSTMYGLARRNYYDSITMNYVGEVFLASANTNTGLITQISSNSVSQGYALAGSAIDPYQMVYYFSTGSNLLGLDIYNGSVYSNVPFQISDGQYFDNFTYSCADTALYGLVRHLYYSYYVDSLFPGDTLQFLDSVDIKLGKVDPNTGIVTTVSPVKVADGGYSLNAGSAIDPNSMTYFFSTGSSIIGVSLITGLVTSNSPFTFAAGEYFDLMRNFENCASASAIRSNPTTLGIQGIDQNDLVTLYPNPSENNLFLKSKATIRGIEIKSVEGKMIKYISVADQKNSINIQDLIPGIYFLNLEFADNSTVIKKIVKQ
ncbi:MAG: T9SS type A sorting domain-containing protein [Bacteroidetes bacterium]|nr:T9SS type A sorting domain-containing protein [Bacteroidota bacterium]